MVSFTLKFPETECLHTRTGRGLATFRQIVHATLPRGDERSRDHIMTRLVQGVWSGMFGAEFSLLEIRGDHYSEERITLDVLRRLVRAGGVLCPGELERLSIADYKKAHRTKFLDALAIDRGEFDTNRKALEQNLFDEFPAAKRTRAGDRLSAALQLAYVSLLDKGLSPSNREVGLLIRDQTLKPSNDTPIEYRAIEQVHWGTSNDRIKFEWITDSGEQRVTSWKDIIKRMGRIRKSLGR